MTIVISSSERGCSVFVSHSARSHNTVKTSILEKTAQVSNTLKEVFGGSSSDNEEEDTSEPESVAPISVWNPQPTSDSIEPKPSPAQMTPAVQSKVSSPAVSIPSSPKPSVAPVPSKAPLPPPKSPSLIAPKNLKLPSPVPSLNLSCSSAYDGFSDKQKSCLAPFYATRPDTVLGANMMGRTAVSCLCGSPYSTSDSYFGYIMEASNNCTTDLPGLTRDKLNAIYESCHAPLRRDSQKIIQTLNLTAYLANGETYQPLSSEDSIAKSTGFRIMVSRTAMSPYAWLGLQGILWLLL